MVVQPGSAHWARNTSWGMVSFHRPWTASSAIMAGRRYPEFNALVIEQYRPVLHAWRDMAARAVARGEAGDAHTSQTVVTMLAAPLFLAPLMLGGPPPDDEIDRIAAFVLAATRP